jgi:hypothetical protein
MIFDILIWAFIMCMVAMAGLMFLALILMPAVYIWEGLTQLWENLF